jgi:hypothetical protein
VRHVLGETAHQARHAPLVDGSLKQRRAELLRAITDLAWRSPVRLHHRYRHLAGWFGPRKALTAVGQELAGLVWAMGDQVAEVPTAARIDEWWRRSRPGAGRVP